MRSSVPDLDGGHDLDEVAAFSTDKVEVHAECPPVQTPPPHDPSVRMPRSSAGVGADVPDHAKAPDEDLGDDAGIDEVGPLGVDVGSRSDTPLPEVRAQGAAIGFHSYYV